MKAEHVDYLDEKYMFGHSRDGAWPGAGHQRQCREDKILNHFLIRKITCNGQWVMTGLAMEWDGKTHAQTQNVNQYIYIYNWKLLR